jgi:hypothetical protein
MTESTGETEGIFLGENINGIDVGFADLLVQFIETTSNHWDIVNTADGSLGILGWTLVNGTSKRVELYVVQEDVGFYSPGVDRTIIVISGEVDEYIRAAVEPHRRMTGEIFSRRGCTESRFVPQNGVIALLLVLEHSKKLKG